MSYEGKGVTLVENVFFVPSTRPHDFQPNRIILFGTVMAVKRQFQVYARYYK